MTAMRVEATFNGVTLEIEALKQFGLSDPRVVAFISNLERFRQIAGLESFEVKRISNTDDYSYRFTGVGGRQWDQTLLGPFKSSDPPTIINASGGWKLSELTFQRDVVVSTLDLIRQFEVQSVEASW